MSETRVEADWHGLTVSGVIYREGPESWTDEAKIDWPDGLPKEFREWIEAEHMEDIDEVLSKAADDDERDGPEYTGEEDL